MTPLGRRVLIEREATVENFGSIIIPEKARRAPQMGKVMAVGSEVDTVKVGDTVLFGKHAAIDVDGVGTFLWAKDIMAVIHGD